MLVGAPPRACRVLRSAGALGHKRSAGTGSRTGGRVAEVRRRVNRPCAADVSARARAFADVIRGFAKFMSGMLGQDCRLRVYFSENRGARAPDDWGPGAFLVAGLRLTPHRKRRAGSHTTPEMARAVRGRDTGAGSAAPTGEEKFCEAVPQRRPAKKFNEHGKQGERATTRGRGIRLVSLAQREEAKSCRSSAEVGPDQDARTPTRKFLPRCSKGTGRVPAGDRVKTVPR